MATDFRIEADNTVGQLATLSEELGKVGVNIDGFCATVGGGRGVLMGGAPGAVFNGIVSPGFRVIVWSFAAA